MLFSQAKSLDIIVPRNLKQSTLSIESPLTIMGASGFFLFLKSTIISRVYDAFSCRLLVSHHDTRLLTSWRYSDSSESDTSPTNVVSSANFSNGTEE